MKLLGSGETPAEQQLADSVDGNIPGDWVAGGAPNVIPQAASLLTRGLGQHVELGSRRLSADWPLLPCATRLTQDGFHRLDSHAKNARLACGYAAAVVVCPCWRQDQKKELRQCSVS